MRIKNWSQFQHFKDRRPPWIKLYRDILDDIEWHSLDSQASKVLVMCWLIASENDGKLPDTKTLAFRLRMSEKNTSESIIKLSHWLEQDDINTISERYQDDLPETETERETETKKEKKATVVATPEGVEYEVWQDYVELRKKRRATITDRVIDGLRQEAINAQMSLNDVVKMCVVRGWQSFRAEWAKSEKQTYAQQAADIARITVPSKKERDPALVKLDQDKMLTKPPSLETLQKMALLRKGA